MTLDEEYAKHLANLNALARTLHDSVHVVRVELQSIDENLANLNRVSDGGDADFPFEGCRDVYAALADARRRIREVERIVRSYRRDLADAVSEAPGQVEPEPAAGDKVRLTDMQDRVEGGETICVTCPDWNDGRPVRIFGIQDSPIDLTQRYVAWRPADVAGPGTRSARFASDMQVTICAADGTPTS